jgi:transcriptional regulator with XRE-family HTH domain
VEAIPKLGQRIQHLREQRGLSVKELADRAGTTYQSIWRIALIRGIARALGVGVDHLIGMFMDDSDHFEEAPTSLAMAGTWNEAGGCCDVSTHQG